MRGVLSCVGVAGAGSIVLALWTAPASAADNAALEARGKRLFLRCKSCHDLAPSDLVKVGPHLQGVVGRKVASVKGFKYSQALSSQKFVWSEAMLDRWLQKPTAVVPLTTMALAGIPDPVERRELIAYLKRSK